MAHLFIKTPVSASMASVCVGFLVISIHNITFWQQLSTATSWPFMFSVVIVLFSFFYACLAMVSFRFLYKPIVLIILLVAALSSYAMQYFGFVITAQAFHNIVETHQQEIQDFLSWRLIVYLTLLFVLPALVILKLKLRYPSPKILVINLLICLALILANLVLLSGNYTFLIRNTRQMRYYLNPVRPIYALAKFVAQQFNTTTEFTEIDAAASRLNAAAKPKLVVLVVGESDRALNQSLNGYSKLTNRLLSQREIYSFNNFSACGTETAVSLPCMFAASNREDFNQQKSRYTANVLDLLHKAQVRVTWLDNNGGCKHICDRIPYNDFTSQGNSDDVLLHNFEKYLDLESADKLIVLHRIGNHGPAYYKRYPQQFKHFLPTCDTNELQNCTKQQIVNTYDNIILYNDFFLDQIIQKLEKMNDYQTALIYVSDHGESLGENGIYLHGMPYWLAPKEQTQIPFFFWASQDFAVDRARLQQIRQQPFSHDNIFHTLLGMYRVQSTAYKAELDMFRDIS